MKTTEENKGKGAVDLMWVAALSFMLVVYLLLAGFFESAGVCAETDESVVAAAPAPKVSVAKLPHDWVEKNLPVPCEVLYSFDNPAPVPAHEAKARTWHNKILFPTVRCPYCGRRVPTKSGSYLFLIVGFIGQLIFSCRFLVQWLASEKAGESVIPVAFWWLSIGGSLMLFVYAISIVAWPIILGQAPNVFIYGRNLVLIKRKRAMMEMEIEDKS